MDQLYRVKQEELYDTVYRELRAMIVKSQLVPGQKLNQQQLAEQLGVSRTPLLLAFSRLEREMLLEIIPRRGAYVKSLSAREIDDLYALRLRLEPLGASEAAASGTEMQMKELKRKLTIFEEIVSNRRSGSLRQADSDFHMTIMKMSRNVPLQQITSSFSIVLTANLGASLVDPLRSLQDHGEISSAIENHDEVLAEKLMYRHLYDAAQTVKQSRQNG